MGYTIIAPVGDNLDALFIGMKEFPTQNVYLLTPHSYLKNAQSLEKKLTSFLVPVTIIKLENNLMESMFAAFGQICSKYNYDDIIVNVATGDRLSTCAALSAAFANGLKAFGVMEGKPMLLPIMRLSYYHELTESKLKILKYLSDDNYVILTDLSKRIGISLSLLSYHLNGTPHFKGLQQLRLVEIKQQQKNILIKLSDLGKLLLKGYVPFCEPNKKIKKKN